MILSYRAWETDTTARRIQAAQHCYSILKRWLQAQSIPAHVRFRLYQQCVAPTVLYGVHEMGLPASCCKKLVSMINTHYRRMVRSPVHLTHENTTAFFLRLGVQPPWTHLAAHHRRLTTALALKHQSLMEPEEPQVDVCTLSPEYPTCAMHEFVPPTPPLPQASLACPECHRHFAPRVRKHEIHNARGLQKERLKGLTTNGFHALSTSPGLLQRSSSLACPPLHRQLYWAHKA